MPEAGIIPFFITLFWAYGMTQAMPADNAGSRESFFFINIDITRGSFTYGSASETHNH